MLSKPRRGTTGLSTCPIQVQQTGRSLTLMQTRRTPALGARASRSLLLVGGRDGCQMLMGANCLSAGKKKGQTQHLTTFLNQESSLKSTKSASWADELDATENGEQSARTLCALQ